MAAPRTIQRRPSTPAQATSASGVERSLPNDVMFQTCQRVWAASLAFAALWAFALFMNNVVARILGVTMLYYPVWPMPGNLIAGIGLAASLVMAYLARVKGFRQQLLLDLGSGYLVLTSLLVGLIEQWEPHVTQPSPSWIIVGIVVYPSIVPNTVRKTLFTGLLAASMGPLALWISTLRGQEVNATLFNYLWAFLPNYIAAAIAVVPVKVIRRLGQQVNRARELGSYRLEEVLGKGGMGEVYRATHHTLARPAAIKLIRQEVLGGTSAAGARLILERFRREAQATASLKSPHTISLYDFGVSEDGTFFLVMELLDGLDLERLVQTFGPVSAERAVYLLTQACASLEEAHVNGLVHRDIKGGNIFICRLGLEVDFVKVLDFGLVKAENMDPGQSMLTAPNATAGTPAYIAPETVLGTPVDHRADIYALGCVAYWLVTGKLVFDAPSAVAMMLKHANEPPIPPSRRTEIELPPAFDEVVLSCLAKRPQDRPQSAKELALRLQAAVPGAAWDEERAARWWERHRPLNAVSEECVECDMRLMPALTSEPDAVEEASGAR
jgi:tRNA A-37 threonylcarbamoyl transferase component Bud32